MEMNLHQQKREHEQLLQFFQQIHIQPVPDSVNVPSWHDGIELSIQRLESYLQDLNDVLTNKMSKDALGEPPLGNDGKHVVAYLNDVGSGSQVAVGNYILQILIHITEGEVK